MLALAAGTGFSALAILLLNLNSGLASGILSILLLPGWVVSSFPSRSNDLYSPLGVLGANATIYAGLPAESAGLGFFCGKAKFALTLSAVPALVLVSLACVPSLNPTRPSRCRIPERRASRSLAWLAEDGSDREPYAATRGIVTRVEVNFPGKRVLFPVGMYANFGDWGYDELTPGKNGLFRHEVLFASGSTLSIEFKKFAVHKQQIGS